MNTDFCQDIRERFTRSFLDIMVLRLLKINPMWGYKLMPAIQKEYGLKVGPSVIYPLLNNLEKNRLVDVKETMIQKRIRKIYTPTEKGVRKLNCLRLIIEELNESM